MRPGDLVGAIANESGLEGRQIGPIRISDNFSVVGVPERKVDDVIAAMRSTVIRGKKTIGAPLHRLRHHLTSRLVVDEAPQRRSQLAPPSTPRGRRRGR